MAHCVGPTGTGVLDDVLDLMLLPPVIGTSQAIHVMNVTVGTYFSSVIDNEAIPFVMLHPYVQELIIPRSLTENHYVVLHVNICTAVITIYDSIASELSAAILISNDHVLQVNIWGTSTPTTYQLVPGPQQARGSNDCAIFAFRNVVMLLLRHQEIPILGGVTLCDGSEIDRASFRALFDLAYPGMGRVYSMGRI